MTERAKLEGTDRKASGGVAQIEDKVVEFEKKLRNDLEFMASESSSVSCTCQCIDNGNSGAFLLQHDG